MNPVIIAAIITGVCTFISAIASAILSHVLRKRFEKASSYRSNMLGIQNILVILVCVGLSVMIALFFYSQFRYYSATTEKPVPATSEVALSGFSRSQAFDARSFDAAMTSLEEKGFNPYEIRRVYSNDEKVGTIFGLLPDADSQGRINEGSDVVILISSGCPIRHVDNVIGMDADEARERFRSNGCDRLYTWVICSSKAEDQVVLWQYPEPGTTAEPETYTGYMIIGLKTDTVNVNEDGRINISGAYDMNSKDDLISWLSSLAQ